jgi:ubiquinone/menaquinone biosynthesis C-methylase UbiE
LRENDAPWLAYHVLDRGAARVSRFFGDRAAAREVSRGLSGTNTRAANRKIWNEYDWSEAGEEWSASPEWQASVVDHLLKPNLQAGANALEIGPGAGRWTAPLVAGTDHLTVIDVSDEAIRLCREKFGHLDGIDFVVNDGSRLEGVEDASIDFIWSFDVFVHIAPADQAKYHAEFARVMKPGARGLIHHGGAGGGKPKAWRSSMTAERFVASVEENGLKVIEQFDRWGPNDEFTVPTEGDIVTIFER